jgi:hypothetical protein
MRVRLSRVNLQLAQQMAQSRNDKPQYTNRRFDATHDDWEIHYMSALAEVAWGLATGWPIDLTRSWGDGGVDFTANGRTYQVKARDTRRRRQPDLLCRPSHATADRFILAEVNVDAPHSIHFVGWCTREELSQQTVYINGKGDRHIRRRAQLRPIPHHVAV